MEKKYPNLKNSRQYACASGLQSFWKSVVLIAFFAFFQNVNSQSISPTNVRDGVTNPGNCSVCAPTNWFNNGGTPDMSNDTRAATTGTTGGGSRWRTSPADATNLTLPLPPNGHESWLSLRDLGTAGTEESVRTTVTGLTNGRKYELIVYSLTAVTQRRNGSYYAGAYNDSFRFTADGVNTVTVPLSTPNQWNVSKLRFPATGTTSEIVVYPGANGDGGDDTDLFETVQISVTVDAITEIPIATPDTGETCMGVATTVNVVANDSDEDDDIDVATVDLDPNTAGRQTSFSNATGTWSVNNSGVVTFTPNATFSGTATIQYTVNDTFSLTATNDESATSDPVSITVTVNPSPTVSVNAVTVCEDDTINLQGVFTASGTSTSAVSWSWSGPNGYTSTAQNPNITNATTAMAGTYTVEVEDNNGCTNTATATVVVNEKPTVTAGATATTVLVGENINLQGTSTTATSYSWSGPNGFTSNVQNPTISNATNAMSGVYTVTATDANGCTNTDTVTITIQNAADLFVAKTVDNATPKKGQNITYTIQVTNSGPSQSTGVVVEDTLPAGLSYVSSTMSGSNSLQTVIWNVGTINSGQTITLTVTATIDVGGCAILTNNTEITQSNEIDTDSTPNSGN